MMVVAGFRPRDRDELARLYWDAFRDKLDRVLGPEPKALALIGRVANPRHVLCAYDADGRLLGAVGFHTAAGAFVGGGLSDLQAVYGRLDGTWRAACLAALLREAEADVFHVDGIFVRPGARSRGVGTALLEALAREATVRGYRALRLEVVDRNDRARALYARRGFRALETRRLRLGRLILGIRATVTMERRLG